MIKIWDQILFLRKKDLKVSNRQISLFFRLREKNFKVNSNLGHVFTRNKSKTSLSYTQLLPNKLKHIQWLSWYKRMPHTKRQKHTEHYFTHYLKYRKEGNSVSQFSLESRHFWWQILKIETFWSIFRQYKFYPLFSSLISSYN